jgi:catechol 2,3-dioxygenase-like lactoylglutathione lyase family enzyme
MAERKVYALRGPTAVPGCGDFCFVWEGSIELLRAMLDQAGAKIIEGPVERMGGRHGGRAKGTSFYVRDPDLNLLEFMVYPDGVSV